MTAKEAYEIICREHKERFIIGSCREYENLYAFILKPEGSTPNDRVFVGGQFVCVNKRTGKVFIEDIREMRGKKWHFVKVG